MGKKDSEERVSFQEMKEAGQLIMRNEKAKNEFVTGVKEVLNYERKYLFMMIAGLLMMFIGIMGLLGFVLFVTSFIMFGSKLIHYTFWENEGFMDIYYEFQR